MRTRERPLSAEEKGELQSYSKSGRQLLAVPDAATTAEIVETVDNYVDAWPRRDPAKVSGELARSADMIDLSWALGAFWGEQIVREFGWSWTALLGDGAERYGVVSANRALAVLPAYFVRECLYDAGRDFTAMLMFNMVKAGSFNAARPNGYLDLSETVVRIVPRR